MDFRVSYEQNERIEAQGLSCSGELQPKSKAGRLTYCRQAVPTCSAGAAVTTAFECALEVALEASLGLLLLFSPLGSGAERILLDGDKFVFVSIDKFAQGDSDGVTQASSSKPLIGMANDPFRQGAFEEVGLVNALSLQPTNLVRRELGMNPRINLVRFVITARCEAIWIHRWLGAVAEVPGRIFLSSSVNHSDSFSKNILAKTLRVFCLRFQRSYRKLRRL